jgi:hypothetical protein
LFSLDRRAGTQQLSRKGKCSPPSFTALLATQEGILFIDTKSVLCILFVIGISLLSAAQYQVTYQSQYNDKPGEDRIYLYENNIAGLAEDDTETHFLDFNQNTIVTALTVDGTTYKKSVDFSSFGEPKLLDETETILGYTCQKASYDLFSNKLDVWYTTQTQAKGSPIFTGFLPNSLVLKLVYNGNFTLTASAMEEYTDTRLHFPGEDAREIDTATYEKLLIESRYQRITIFDHEQINFGEEINNPSEEILDHTYRFSSGTVVMKKITLPQIHPNGNVFIKLTTWSNGDAYDRTGTVFTISEKAETSILDALRNGVDTLPIYRDVNGTEYQGVTLTDDYLPPIELMRFYTTFGVGHFNDRVQIGGYNWSDSVVFKQEITDLIEQQDTMWIGVFIGNYDKGGHRISLELNYYPEYSQEQARERWVYPLFSTINILEMSGQNYGRMFKDDTLRLSFELPDGIDDLQLRFISTGHGGWGNGDEFVKRANRIRIDGKEIFRIIPWREDCGTYRLNNPASGNFANGLSSSDLSRSNWCPGTITTPYYIPLDDLNPGHHTLEIAINQGDDEGNSFNSWNVSGVLIGNK